MPSVVCWTQIGLNNAVLDELLSVVYLYKALGGGFYPYT